MISDVKVTVDAMSSASPLSNGLQYLLGNPQGGIYTMDWVDQLIAAGRVYSLDLGTAGTPLAGNAAIDADQPEFVVSCDTGWLIPIHLQIGAECDSDAEEDIQVLLVGDRTNGTATLTATAETPLNLLDGGDAFGGEAYSVVTGNMTLTEADILFNKYHAATQVDASGTLDTSLFVDHVFPAKPRLAGPCQIIGYVVGTATAPNFYGRLVFAHLPSSWVRTS